MHASGRAVRSAGAPGGLELLERDFGQPSSRVVLCFCCFSSRRGAGPLACAPVLLCRHAGTGLVMVLCGAGGHVHLGAPCHGAPGHASLQCWWPCTPWRTLSVPLAILAGVIQLLMLQAVAFTHIVAAVAQQQEEGEENEG